MKTPSPERARARRSLRAERARLRACLEALESEAQPEAPPVTDEEERSAADTALELEHALIEANWMGLERVERALVRLGDPSYGRCADCGEPIAATRLCALPFAESCLACAAAREEAAALAGPRAGRAPGCPDCGHRPCRCARVSPLPGEVLALPGTDRQEPGGRPVIRRRRFPVRVPVLAACLLLLPPHLWARGGTPRSAGAGVEKGRAHAESAQESGGAAGHRR